MRQGRAILLKEPCHCTATELCRDHWAILHLLPDLHSGRPIGRQGLHALSRIFGQSFDDEVAAIVWIKEHL